MDRITIRNIVAHGRHGANPGERDRSQPFHLEIELELDLSRPGASDDLRDSVNYAEVYETVRSIVEEQSFHLLERLGSAILDAILSDARIATAAVSIAKPDLLDGATPCVRMSRANAR